MDFFSNMIQSSPLEHSNEISSIRTQTKNETIVLEVDQINKNPVMLWLVRVIEHLQRSIPAADNAPDNRKPTWVTALLGKFLSGMKIHTL
jgi:hypothetical protein